MVNSACIVSIVRLTLVGKVGSSSDPSCESTAVQKKLQITLVIRPPIITAFEKLT